MVVSKAVHDWLARRADTSVGRLALQWFRAYFAASRSSGCAVTVYSALSVLPAVLVVAAVLHPSSGDANLFAQRLISHLKLNGATASLVQGTFGSASSNALAASLTVFVSFLLWGIGIGQIYQDVYARAWGIKVDSLADQGLFAIFFFVLTGVLALAVLATVRLHDTGWLVLDTRLARRLDGVLALGAAVPAAPEDRTACAAARRAARLRRARRDGRHLAVLPGSPVGRERQDLRLVRGRDHVHRRRVRADHDVAGVRGLLACVGELARDGEATPRYAMTAGPDHNDEPEQIELPRPKRTLLGRLAHWVEHAQALKGWVREARGRSPALDATFETIERDSHIGGGILAGALSYRLFVFLLPLAFFLVSGLGLLASALGVQPHVVVNSVGIAGTVTKEVQGAAKGSSSWWVALTSLLVLAYMTRVLLRAVSIVHALAWEGSAASVRVSSRQLEIFAAALAGQLLLVAGVGAVYHQTAIGGIIALVVFVVALAGLWLVVSLQLPHADARWTDLIPGSLFYAIGFVAVEIFNVLILGQMIKEKSTTYGALGIAGAILLDLFLIGRVIVGAAVVNATLYERSSRARPQQA